MFHDKSYFPGWELILYQDHYAITLCVCHDNCIFLDGAYFLPGSISDNVVYFMINCIFLDGDLYLISINMQ